jgi:DNA-binding XRE family transcriptional regulator
MISYMKTDDGAQIVSQDEYSSETRAAWSAKDHDLSQRLELEFEVRNQRNALSEVVKNRRLELNLTQRSLAKLVGVSTRDICHIEQAKANPTLSTQVKLLNALGLKLEITAQ